MHQLELGKTTKTKTPITISLKERKQGTYVIGTTGTGKSTFLNLVGDCGNSCLSRQELSFIVTLLFELLFDSCKVVTELLHVYVIFPAVIFSQFFEVVVERKAENIGQHLLSLSGSLHTELISATLE